MYWWAFGGGGDALEGAHHLSSIHTQEKSEKEKKEKKRSRPTHPFTYPMPHNQLLSQTSLSSLSKEGACISQARACFTTSNSFSTEIKKLRKFFLFFYLFPIRFFSYLKMKYWFFREAEYTRCEYNYNRMRSLWWWYEWRRWDGNVGRGWVTMPMITLASTFDFPLWNFPLENLRFSLNILCVRMPVCNVLSSLNSKWTSSRVGSGRDEARRRSAVRLTSSGMAFGIDGNPPQNRIGRVALGRSLATLKTHLRRTLLENLIIKSLKEH